MIVEIAVQDLEGANIAYEEGAGRIELCAALGSTGGLTPSRAMIEACAAVGLPHGVQVLIRPRAGSFVFDDAEKQLQLQDVRYAIESGAEGVVVGGLDTDGRVDVPFASALAEAARDETARLGRDVQITFHRAFDMVPDRIAALDALIELGYTRVLTSGGAPDVARGTERLAELVRHAAGRIEIQAGGGVNPNNVRQILRCGVDAVHLSAKHVVAGNGGPGGGGDAGVERTDRDTVRRTIEIVHRWQGTPVRCE